MMSALGGCKMARIAVLADVHGDHLALADAIDRATGMGCDLLVCAGDIVDYGLFPEETIELLRGRSVVTISGNHDKWAVGRGRADAPDAAPEGEPFDALGLGLPDDAVGFLASLPNSWSTVLGGVRVGVWHARPGSDMDGIDPHLVTDEELRRLLEQDGVDVLVVGHTHVPMCLEVPGGGLVVNPGALLRDPAEPPDLAWHLEPESGTPSPAPAVPPGTFGVLELPERRFTVRLAADGTEVEIARRRVRPAHLGEA